MMDEFFKAIENHWWDGHFYSDWYLLDYSRI